MKNFLIIVVVILTCISIIIQLRNPQEIGFKDDLVFYLPFAMLIITTIISLVYSLKHFKLKNLLSFILGVICILSVLGIKYYRSDTGYGQTAFTAYNDDINNGLLLDFKSNNNLKVEEMFEFGSTIYWGSYTINGDTIQLEISDKYKYSLQAIKRNDTLYFSDGHKFLISKPIYRN